MSDIYGLRGYFIWQSIQKECVICPDKFKDGFHMEYSTMVDAPDAYLFGIRANHFNIEVGWSETSDYDGEDEILILVTANHKGDRVSRIYRWK